MVEEDRDAEQIFARCSTGAKECRIDRVAVGAQVFLHFDAVRIARTDFMQGDQVRCNQAQQYQRDGDHVEGEEAVQGRVGNDVVAADPQRQVRADQRDGAKQVDDHLCAPVRHLAPWQQVAEERFGHQAQEDGETEQPDQFTWLAVRAVQQAARHVQVDDDEEGRGARRVHVAHQPAPRHFAHDVLDGIAKARASIRFVVHGQEDAGDDLQYQHQHGQRTEDVPDS